MKYKFRAQTGVNENAKFLVFLIFNREEIPLYRCMQENIVSRDGIGYQSEVRHIKVFSMDIKDKIMKSFYVDLTGGDNIKITSHADPELFFECTGSIMPKEKALEILRPGSMSHDILFRTGTMKCEIDFAKPKTIGNRNAEKSNSGKCIWAYAGFTNQVL